MATKKLINEDKKTAQAFADSWNNLPLGSVYTFNQFVDWFEPNTELDIKGKKVLELGCGNASLMLHLINWRPAELIGVDLGDSVKTAKTNLEKTSFSNYKILQADLIAFKSPGFDFVYSIGVLHHLKNPKKGMDAVIENTKAGGRFHVWVYAREGNWAIINVVDRIRKISSKLPWWLTKYFIATPLVMPYFVYAKFLHIFKKTKILSKVPLYEYSLWIAERNFAFFRHVAFDQLVTPQTTYLDKKTVTAWLASYPQIKKDSIYIIKRNGNSWKFGGQIKKNE